ncbi:unnamed protein product [Closterium sp. NIES-64]|nr:unnamed protein product [Closterium sp. NIES-64]
MTTSSHPIPSSARRSIHIRASASGSGDQLARSGSGGFVVGTRAYYHSSSFNDGGNNARLQRVARVVGVVVVFLALIATAQQILLYLSPPDADVAQPDNHLNDRPDCNSQIRWNSLTIVPTLPPSSHSNATPTPLPCLPAFGRTCPGDCSGNGVCNAEFGECRCRHGYTGLDCSQTEDYPCNLPATPESPLGPWIVSICAAHCDLRRAQCRCGPNTSYPDRPVVAPCGFPKAPDGIILYHKPDVTPVYGPQTTAITTTGSNGSSDDSSSDSTSSGGSTSDSSDGSSSNSGNNSTSSSGSIAASDRRVAWCEAQPSQIAAAECFCNYDGQIGRLCETTVESFCINQCSRAGTCSMGYCEVRMGGGGWCQVRFGAEEWCEVRMGAEGWRECEGDRYGIDCSIPSVRSPPDLYPPEWLRIPLPHQPDPDSSSDYPDQNPGSAPDSLGSSSVYEASGVNSSISSSNSSNSNSSIEGAAAPAAAAAGVVVVRGEEEESTRVAEIGTMVNRTRPLIYVYDLPPEFTFHNLEARQWKSYCGPRAYSHENDTLFNDGWLYGLETAVFEGFLGSPHRTLDGDSADFFYVPLLGACIIARSDDSPRFRMEGQFKARRPNLVADFYLRALAHIRTHHPFWDRHGGKDHIWMFAWDEGACYAPQAIWSSIMLAHWGNTGSTHKGCTTAYYHDDWSVMEESVRGDHPCFDPEKDVVMPAWKVPGVWARAQKIKSPTLETRPTLFYFNGNLGSAFERGRVEPKYSMGIRQKVAEEFASSPNKEGQLGRQHQEDVVVTNRATGEYGKQLAASRFCGVFPGDGFSARMEDAMLHGCIPVIVQDGVWMAFERHLNYSEFAVRVAEDDIPHLVDILRAIPLNRVQELLAGVESMWQRWAYASVARMEGRRQAHGGRPQLWMPAMEDLRGDDAIATLLQVLLYKRCNDPWRKEAGLPDWQGSQPRAPIVPVVVHMAKVGGEVVE